MLLFVRHAESKANVHHKHQRKQQEKLGDAFNYAMYPHDDPDITEIGQRQARAAGRFFKKWMDDTGIRPDKIIISPFLRTIHTASLFLAEAGYTGKVILEPLVREYRDTCPSTRGTAKDDLLRVLEESEHLLSDWDVDTSLLTDDIWFDEQTEDDARREQRAQDIRDKYVEYKDDNEIVLAFSHGSLGGMVHNTNVLLNCEIMCLERGKAARSLFAPGNTMEALKNDGPSPS